MRVFYSLSMVSFLFAMSISSVSARTLSPDEIPILQIVSGGKRIERQT